MRRNTLALGIGLVMIGCGAAQPVADARGSQPPLEVSIEELDFAQGEQEVARETVAESVEVRAAAQHSALPPAVRDGAPDPDAWPQLTVLNETAHGLVVWVSGPCARTIALPPQSQNSVEVCEGGYQLAGQVAIGNFLPLVGEQEIFENGYHYTFSFFVQTNPYERSRRRRRRR